MMLLPKEYIFRGPTSDDIPALSKLHAAAWRETYEAIYPQKTDWPSAELRESQWRALFSKNDRTWFCYVIENETSELIGFARGQEYNYEAPPGIKGELNKLYLLKKYHGKGLGVTLFKLVVSEFLSQGINSMIAFTDPKNPTRNFFKKYGGQKLYAENGEFHGAYAWRSLSNIIF